MKVLITGATGQVGRALAAMAPAQVEVQALSRKQLDVSDLVAVGAAIKSAGVDLVVNAAAYTAVDKAESEPECAAAVNANGPGYIAQVVRGLPRCRLIHISTDYVFDGRSAEPYRPVDEPNPLNVYGKTKLAGERAVLELLDQRVVVLRTAWVYARLGRNFLVTMLRKMREGGLIRVVGDQRGTPTCASSVAQAIWRLAELPEVHGILHWTDAGAASWYEFASAIASLSVEAGLLDKCPELHPVTASEFRTVARRPASSILDLRDTAGLLELVPIPWRANVRATLAELVDGADSLDADAV